MHLPVSLSGASFSRGSVGRECGKECRGLERGGPGIGALAGFGLDERLHHCFLELDGHRSEEDLKAFKWWSGLRHPSVSGSFWNAVGQPLHSW